MVYKFTIAKLVIVSAKFFFPFLALLTLQNTFLAFSLSNNPRFHPIIAIFSIFSNLQALIIES